MKISRARRKLVWQVKAFLEVEKELLLERGGVHRGEMNHVVRIEDHSGGLITRT
jgi:hypothetical protein